MEKWFDWPQNCYLNPCYVEVEVDCYVEEEDEYIERVGAIH